MIMEIKNAIHLLYVPTEYCNMNCKYCYLDGLTEKQPDENLILETLDLALEKLLTNGYLPFNLSFHGGEVTTLPGHSLNNLFNIAAQYYAQYGDQIKENGFRVNPLHIKTNLLNFQQHWDVFIKHDVSISGSVDLPLHLHERFRRDKNDRSTLSRIKDNLKALATYPHNKKISCVVTRAHLEAVDEFIDAIKHLHYDLGLDMSHFNVMFGFDSGKKQNKSTELMTGTEMLSGVEQVRFYKAIKKAFTRTPLENAFKTEWFKEFTPDFCCSSPNCGGKFFLLQADGDVFSCPRGQSSKHYRYGNIYHDDIEGIISNGFSVIERNENRMEISDDCTKCLYLPYCNLGCTFVRQEAGMNKSYTCQLQKHLYLDNSDRWPPFSKDKISEYVKYLFLHNNIKRLESKKADKKSVKKGYITTELNDDSNLLSEIIRRDSNLQSLYSEDLFFLLVNDVKYWLRSAILKYENDIEVLDETANVQLGVRNDVFRLSCDDEVNNYLQFILLRNTNVVYGDEQRTKQEHIFDYSLYRNSFIHSASKDGDYLLTNISWLLKSHEYYYLDGVKNNLFITTKALREYHYTKHKKNAFYHIQAINLPFQNIEFFWHRRLS